MSRILRTLRQQWLGALGLIVGLTGVAYGATGQPAVLGQLNRSDKTTTVRNTADGPALSLKVKKGQAPFAVNSAVKVRRLNASRLGGKLPSAFAPAGSSYTKAQSDARYAANASLGSYYTKTETDAAFLPAGYLVLRTFGGPFLDVNVVDGVTELLNHNIVAPGSGTLHVLVFGRCSGPAGSLEATADGTSTSDGFAGGPGYCTATDSVTVTAGDAPLLTAYLKSTSGTSELRYYTGLVYFVPD